MRNLIAIVIAGGLAASTAPATLQAQGNLYLKVQDTLGIAIPYVSVMADPGGQRIADDSGRVTYRRLSTTRPVALRLRRIGYAEQGLRITASEDTTVVVMTPLARTVASMEITERASTPLSRRGFYERAQEIHESATVGEFITPEDLDRLGVVSVSRALGGARYVQVSRVQPGGGTVLLGRGSCGMNIVVDGMLIRGTYESGVGGAGSPANAGAIGMHLSDVEDAVAGGALAGIEIYPSVANAPPAIKAIVSGGRGTCGVVVFWTGARR